MSSFLLGLPPVPPELKVILPYLQRADELKQQDPIIAYWCFYYAAQLGINLKSRSNPSRDLLFGLLGVLEKMKTSIGPHDAIDIESVSSAYAESFAMKVFANADNEDRYGCATRSTAKKFLAAVNFLEVLRTFPKNDMSDSTEEKIRYAKWKAADIAKAFREGRRPAPGPPGWAEEQEELKALQREQEELSMFTAPINHQELTAISSHASNQRHSPPQDSNSTSNNHFNISPPQRPAAGWSDPPSDTWSTTATSGRDVPNMFVLPNPHSLDATSAAQTASINDSLAKPLNRNTAHTIDAFSGSARGPLKKPAWTNEELEGKFSPSSSPKKSSLKSGSPESDKKVRFSPLPVELGPAVPSSPKSNSPPKVYTGPDSIYATPPPSQARASPPSIIASPSHPAVSHSSILPPPPPIPSAPPASYIYAPSHIGGTPPAAQPLLPTPDSFELTPEIIAKVQRRCRYAISALDFEDVETARNELRAALILLDK